MARDQNYNLIPFIKTEDKIKDYYLCNSDIGEGPKKHPQLGPAEKGNCIGQVHITSE